MALSVRPAKGATKMPAARSGRPSRTMRWASSSALVQLPHSVGTSGPTSRRVSHRAPRSAWA